MKYDIPDDYVKELKKCWNAYNNQTYINPDKYFIDELFQIKLTKKEQANG
jgi:hypothetical protein